MRSHKVINFDRLVNFMGRNGYFKQKGIKVTVWNWRASTLKNDMRIVINPITSKDSIGNSEIQIPVNCAKELGEFLIKVHENYSGDHSSDSLREETQVKEGNLI